MNTHHTEHKPSYELAGFIESFWSYRFDTPLAAHSPANICIPKGTIEFIITIRGTAELQHAAYWNVIDDVLVAGIQTSPTTWRVRGGTEMFGMRLKPEAILRLFGRPIAELYQKHLPLRDIIGNRLDWFVDEIRQAENVQERIRIAESFLQKKMAVSRAGNTLLAQAINRIWQEEGNITTASLSKSVFIGERQLQRLFKHTVGVSPKLYSRIVRFRMAYEKAQYGRPSAWTDVAYDHGYTDQAHFVKDFKTFTGKTPTALFN